ncbi:phage tail protein [Pseudoalteromonas sp. NBT06-2]|uniref:tail protein X n=1 Tax=Pseudoalteromonas sp. NBT06-2 TaxID=2025950 RepID=UPI000BA672B5|nr:tail protein X [Pseudoalteromonas sp. NBT06-2]PAJ72285.1 phage tail protein [Pseudoalteromonas sp. NBT06-2]
MSNVNYRTREGDCLDYICWKHYGHLSGVVEKVLEHNPGLAALGELYPENIVIILPEISVSKVSNIVRIWD